MGEISNDLERKVKGGGQVVPDKRINGRGIVLSTTIRKGNDLENHKQCRKEVKKVQEDVHRSTTREFLTGDVTMMEDEEDNFEGYNEHGKVVERPDGCAMFVLKKCWIEL